MAIVKTYANTHKGQTYIFTKHDKATPFKCVRCNKEKKSKNIIDVAGTNDQLCNGCYGEILSK